MSPVLDQFDQSSGVHAVHQSPQGFVSSLGNNPKVGSIWSSITKFNQLKKGPMLAWIKMGT